MRDGHGYNFSSSTVTPEESLYEVVNGVIIRPLEETGGVIDDQAVDDPLYEIVNGVRVESPMSNWAVLANTAIGCHLGIYAIAAGVGRVLSEGLFLLEPNAPNNRRPDVAFVSYERWPRETPVPDDAWPVAADLAVEVISPTDRAEAALAKVKEYLDAGVRLVWVVYPALRVVHVFESFTTIRVVSGADILDGGTVVPGFQIPLSALFEALG
jgi:Uma2 family endonuclease